MVSLLYFFMCNHNKREGGYRKFPHHLLVYLFHRDEFHAKVAFNPIRKMKLTLFDVGKLNERFIEFCQTIFRLNFEELMRATHEDDPLKFKRVMILNTINKEYNLLTRTAYSKLRNQLKITGF